MILMITRYPFNLMAHSTGQILKPLIDMPSSPHDCWEWKGKINKATGYGHKQLGGKTLLAHRWVYSIFNGVIPSNAVIDHLCRNRSCVNPRHLESVTQEVNCRRGKGTKLTREDVKKIKARLPSLKWGERKGLADEFGVTPALISAIKYGRAWAGV